MSQCNLHKRDVLVVFGIVFICLLCVHAAAYRSRAHAKEMVCMANLRLNSLSVLGYAADHEGSVTFNTAGYWPGDISYSATDNLIGYGSTRQGFFCPSNKSVNAFDVRRWQFAMLAMYPNHDYYIDFNESMLTQSQKQQYYRAVTYIFLTDRPTGMPGPFQGTPPRTWIRDLDDISNPQEYEMIVDRTISATSYSQFYNLTSGGLWSLYQLMDQTNHLSKSDRPLGGNIAFADGHVAWRTFSQMQIRTSVGYYHWW